MSSVALCLALASGTLQSGEESFASLSSWFDELGFSSELRMPFEIFDLTRAGVNDAEEVRGFVVRRDKAWVTVLTTSFTRKIFPSDSIKPRNVQGTLENLLSSSSLVDPKLLDGLEELLPRWKILNLFTLSQAARLRGNHRLATALFSSAQAVAKPFLAESGGSFSAYARGEVGERLLDSIYFAFSDVDVSLQKLRERLVEYTRRFPGNPHTSEVRESIRRLSPDLIAYEIAGTSKGQVDALIDQLQDQRAGDPNLGEYGFPSIDNRPSGMVFDSNSELSGPAGKLTALGDQAVPLLILHLGDKRYTRILSGNREHPVLVVGDVCLRILEQIARQVFIDHDISNTPVQDHTLFHLARERVELWWKKSQQHS